MYEQVPEETAQQPKRKDWKRVKVASRDDLIVYEYDENANIYKPYKAQDLKLSEDFPQREITAMFEEISENVAKPPKVKRILVSKPPLLQSSQP